MTAPNRLTEFFDTYTRDLKAEDLQRLFTRDTREAYRFFTRHLDPDALKGLPWHKRAIAHARAVFMAFTMKLSPARRVVFGSALVLALIGLINLFRGIGLIEVAAFPIVGGVGIPGPIFRQGTWSLLFAFLLMNLLVLLEVADRLSLKNDLEIARDIQQAMLPSGLYDAPGVETVGFSRPANTVGGDFYDILPLDDGRLVVTVGDVAGKGSPAALLMALLLAMLRTLVDEKLEPAELVAPCAGNAVHHIVLRRLRSTDRRADVRERRPHGAAAAAQRRIDRAPHRGRHRARHVRALDVRTRTRDDPTE